MPKEKMNIITTKIAISKDSTSNFADWQAKFNSVIADFPGFVSLEFLSSTEDGQQMWGIVQRFNSSENVSDWIASQQRQELIEELKKFEIAPDALKEFETESSHLQAGVTEVFITQVSPEKEQDYRKWIAKIHQAEAKFPGFKGMYVQSPAHQKGQNWITLLQFDTVENLDRWLSSPERQRVLNESKSLISSLESHRVISPYAGWFASIAKRGEMPPVWKQTMVILLVLFPIVMFELKYLNPLLTGLNSSVGTFIGNAISVTLISWPMMPIAIWFLTWWLSPKGTHTTFATYAGTAVMCGLYLIEIALFWRWLG